MSIISRIISKIYNKGVKRRQLNLTIDERIIDVVKLFALQLEVPLYVAAEQLLQTGASHLLDVLSNPKRRRELMEHLVKAHLLGLKTDEGDFWVK